jgi:hypothetical protein
MTLFRRYLFSLLCLFALPAWVSLAQTAPPVSATGHITAQVITTLAAVETSQDELWEIFSGATGG